MVRRVYVFCVIMVGGCKIMRFWVTLIMYSSNCFWRFLKLRNFGIVNIMLLLVVMCWSFVLEAVWASRLNENTLVCFSVIISSRISLLEGSVFIRISIWGIFFFIRLFFVRVKWFFITKLRVRSILVNFLLVNLRVFIVFRIWVLVE